MGPFQYNRKPLTYRISLFVNSGQAGCKTRRLGRDKLVLLPYFYLTVPPFTADLIGVLNRRRHFRAPEYITGLLLILGSDEAPTECRVIDRSPGGMRVLMNKHLPAGSWVEVLIGDTALAGEVRYSAPRPMGQCEIGICTRS